LQGTQGRYLENLRNGLCASEQKVQEGGDFRPTGEEAKQGSRSRLKPGKARKEGKEEITNRSRPKQYNGVGIKTTRKAQILSIAPMSQRTSGKKTGVKKREDQRCNGAAIN